MERRDENLYQSYCQRRSSGSGCVQAVFTELERLCKKYERKVAKEQAKRESDLEIATGYACESDIQNDYGWGFITEQQYECYLDLFRGGVSALENHTATKAERVLKILCRIAHDICEEQHEWEFSALSPAEQAAEIARAAKARKEWDARMRDLKMKRQTCYEEE